MERLRLSDFDYRLPKELIAQYPRIKRANSRLLVLDRAKKKIQHRSFRDILDYFSCADCLVLNNTKVIPARIIGRREKTHPHLGGGKQEIFLLENLPNNTYRVLAKPAKKLSQGRKIFFNGLGKYKMSSPTRPQTSPLGTENRTDESYRRRRFSCQGKLFATVLSDQGSTKIIRFGPGNKIDDPWNRLGQVPLPPYIKRKPLTRDEQSYQTVYSRVPGATASPTAGLHFTKELLADIRASRISIVDLTLHVNYGTFAPVKCEDITRHKMHQEYFTLPQKTVNLITKAKAMGKKVFAVGTTSLRALESCASIEQERLLLRAKKGWTNLFIYPPYRFKVIDCLLTNFHFPRSTLLMLVSAFAGKELIFKAYQEAIKRKYRFFSYGDAMLIL